MVKKHLRSFETDQMRKVRAGEISLDEAILAVAAEERMMKSAARASNLLPVRVLTDASPAAVLDAMAPCIEPLIIVGDLSPGLQIAPPRTRRTFFAPIITDSSCFGLRSMAIYGTTDASHGRGTSCCGNA